VPLCADESCHDTPTLADVLGKYEFINIKLDKTGGVTEAIRLYREAKRQKLGIMVGCMVGTSLAMAPAMLIAQYARFVDLDGPLLLKCDREPGIIYRDGVMSPASAELWG
jgi:L-alanine-DL-glutamate epimerase-like enolase superfamily enzyme